MLKTKDVSFLLKYCFLSFATVFAQVCTVSNNNCITFLIGEGTGCDWMCNYCSNELGTNNYYFADSVCTYGQGGCVGNPIAGKQYTCCAASSEYNDEL